jgi:hypothetical protein
MAKAKAKKAGSKKRSVAARSVSDIKPYGDPIRQAIAQGDPAAMRKMAAVARRWIATTEKELAKVKKALEKLEAVLPTL